MRGGHLGDYQFMIKVEDEYRARRELEAELEKSTYSLEGYLGYLCLHVVTLFARSEIVPRSSLLGYRHPLSAPQASLTHELFGHGLSVALQ
ncbi:hypothetical protein BKA70DRAFT_181515 [Coprinopsis sp. MPI-PUGE-AT-0042]|nr:hypothetical protein BKA70DRAFT_181515 [Coprinopsis sp. MPI-PUGE-AT-0042]